MGFRTKSQKNYLVHFMSVPPFKPSSTISLSDGGDSLDRFATTSGLTFVKKERMVSVPSFTVAENNIIASRRKPYHISFDDLKNRNSVRTDANYKREWTTETGSYSAQSIKDGKPASAISTAKGSSAKLVGGSALDSQTTTSVDYSWRTADKKTVPKFSLLVSNDIGTQNKHHSIGIMELKNTVQAPFPVQPLDGRTHNKEAYGPREPYKGPLAGQQRYPSETKTRVGPLGNVSGVGRLTQNRPPASQYNIITGM